MSRLDNRSLHGQHIDVSYDGEDLSGRILSGTYIGVSFENAILHGARLIGTFISSCFRGADLREADTSTGKFVGNDFTDARISDSKSQE